MLYKVTISEQYCKTIGIDTGSEEEATKAALKAWQDCDRALDQPVLKKVMVAAIPAAESERLPGLSGENGGFLNLPDEVI